MLLLRCWDPHPNSAMLQIKTKIVNAAPRAIAKCQPVHLEIGGRGRGLNISDVGLELRASEKGRGDSRYGDGKESAPGVLNAL